MSANEYVAWFILMAIAIALVIAIGCMGALGMFDREHRQARAEARRRARATPAPGVRQSRRRLRYARHLLTGHHG